MLARGAAPAAEPPAAAAPSVEARLRQIYEQSAFRPRPFRAEWLPDSSGYAIDDREPGADAPRWTTFAVRSGDRIAGPTDRSPVPRPDPARSPAGDREIVREGRTLAVREVEGGRHVVLATPQADRDVTYRDVSWSPDGKRIVFVEADATDVRERTMLVPGDPSYPGIRRQRFARVGGTIERLRVGVVDVAGGDPVWLPLPTPPEGFYLGQVAWAGNAEEVLVEQLSRFRDRRDFFLLTTAGAATPICHEESDTWTDASQGRNAGLSWIRGGAECIVVDETDGWRHAHRRSRDGRPLGTLTPGDYDIIERAVVDNPGGWFYFYASPDDATGRHLFRVPLDGVGTLERITPEDLAGTHHYDFSPDRRWAFHTHSRLDSPPVVSLVELPGHRTVRVLEENRPLRDRLRETGSRPAEFLELEIGDGITLDAWLLTPRDFDPTRKYPVVVYVYGEPHAQTVLDEWGAGQIDFHRVVADLGYLVVSIDNRGTPAPKGAAWRRACFGSLGPLSTEEQAAALAELARRRPAVDLSRVGIWGWSGGGSNTLNALFRKPDVYHVGIAVVPKPQPQFYNAWFQEIFMRTPEVNPEGYRRAAAINYAEGLKGRLLIMTGSGETNTHIQGIEGLVDRLIELGKPFDSMVYPDRDHGLREGKGTLVHVRQRIIRHLLEHLPAGPR